MKTFLLAGRLSKSFSFLAAVLLALSGVSLYYLTEILKPVYEKDTMWIAFVIGEILIVSIIMMIVTRKLCSKYLERQLDELFAGAQRLASGDFSGQLQVYGQDELASFAAAMNNTSSYLVNLLRSVYTISGELIQSTHQLVEAADEENNHTKSLKKELQAIEHQLLEYQEEMAEIKNSLHNMLPQIEFLQEKSEKHESNIMKSLQVTGELENMMKDAGRELVDGAQTIGENYNILIEASEKVDGVKISIENTKEFMDRIKEAVLTLALEAAEEGRKEKAEKAHNLNNLTLEVISCLDKTSREYTSLKNILSKTVVTIEEGNKLLLNAGEKSIEMSRILKDIKTFMENCEQEWIDLNNLIKSGGQECRKLNGQLVKGAAAVNDILESTAGALASAQIVDEKAKTIKTPAQQIKRATKKLHNLSLQFKT